VSFVGLHYCRLTSQASFVDLHFGCLTSQATILHLHFDFRHIKAGINPIENVSRRMPAALLISSTAPTHLPRLKKHSETNMF
jgi:hypothetical protein